MSMKKAQILIPVALLLPVSLTLGYLQWGVASEFDQLEVTVVAPISPPGVGESPIKVLVLDRNGNPVTDLALRVDGRLFEGTADDVLSTGNPEPEAGIYAIPFNWQQPGLWKVELNIANTEGQTTKRKFQFMAHDTTWICGITDWKSNGSSIVSEVK